MGLYSFWAYKENFTDLKAEHETQDSTEVHGSKPSDSSLLWVNVFFFFLSFANTLHMLCCWMRWYLLSTYFSTRKYVFWFFFGGVKFLFCFCVRFIIRSQGAWIEIMWVYQENLLMYWISVTLTLVLMGYTNKLSFFFFFFFFHPLKIILLKTLTFGACLNCSVTNMTKWTFSKLMCTWNKSK